MTTTTKSPAPVALSQTCAKQVRDTLSSFLFGAHPEEAAKAAIAELDRAIAAANSQ